MHAYRKKPETQARLVEIRKMTDRRIAHMGANAGARAVKELISGLKSDDEGHRRLCANDILGKFGHPSGSRVEVSGGVELRRPLDVSKLTSEQLDTLADGRDLDDEAEVLTE